MTHLNDSVFPVHLQLNCGSDELGRPPTSLILGLTHAHTTVQLRLDILILVVAEFASRQIGFVEGTVVGASEGDITVQA